MASLAEVLSLPPDWDSYDSIPPTKEAGVTAEKLLAQLPDSTEACPISGGGIQLSFVLGDVEHEVEIGPSGEIMEAPDGMEMAR
jgi:hypothetical protein